MKNCRIAYLEIDNFGVFEHLRIDFSKDKKDPENAEIHILTGENGTGKTTILECLTIKFDDKPGKTTNTNFSKGKDRENVFRFGIENSHKRDKYIINQQKELEQRETYEFAAFCYAGYRKISGIKVIGPQRIEDSPLKDSLNFSKSINPHNLIQWIVNTKTNELNSKGRGDFEKAKLFKKTLEILENVISDIINQSVLFDIDDNFDVLLIIDELSLPFDVMPDGLKSMTLWLGDLLMRMDRIKWKDDLPIFERNFILFLDEIEVHLHPAWQRKILPVVQKLFKNAQIFISTHSPFVVGSVDGAWVHKLKKEGAYAVLDGEPTLSSDGKTFVQILADTFDITSLFGEQNERKILKFKAIKDLILSGQQYDETEFNTLIDELSKESRALENLISMEIKQINKTLGIDILAIHATV
ncbi:MAG: AAA family ATPase [Arcicella sp.]|jgi:predicted ATP-dependent endonuclease of OLD family|nr:AAA family ATPase [Arcicella sp.]